MIFVIEPKCDYVRELKLKKIKKDDIPGDVLGIYSMLTGKFDSVKNIKNHEIPEEWAGWLAYQMEIHDSLYF